MRRSDKSLSETDIWPEQCDLQLVRCDVADQRPFFAAAPVCTLLSRYKIRHAAVAALPAPFRIVRTRLGGSYFLACLGGTGKVLIDGRWVNCRKGQAALLPPGTLQAFHAAGSRPWEIAWVRYQESPGQRPLATAQTPIVARYDGAQLRLAILGTHGECLREGVPALMEQWVRLIHHYVEQFAQPAGLDARLWRLWERVSQSLQESWSLAEMSRETHVGEKQLQRLCQQQLGRTPRQHLIWLRMRRAADLLTETELKVEAVARQVGYENPFVFSTTFKRVMGWSPSEYPGRR